MSPTRVMRRANSTRVCAGIKIKSSVKVGALAYVAPPTQVAPAAPHWLHDLAAWVAQRQRTGAHWLEAWLNPNIETLDTARFWELDAARGLAIGMMVLVHLGNGWLRALSPALANAALSAWLPIKIAAIVGLVTFWTGAALFHSPTVTRWLKRITANEQPGWRALIALVGGTLLGTWMAFASSGSSAFRFILGLGMAIGFDRATDKSHARRKLAIRGAQLFGLGMVVTAMSLVLSPQAPVWFGILQSLGASTLLAIPFLGLPDWVITSVALAVMGIGELIVPRIAVENLGWLWLGLHPAHMPVIDYGPLLPWFGVTLLGIAVGKVAYAGGRARQFNLPAWSETRVARALSKLGKHSLAIFMLQAPLYLSGMTAAGIE